MFPYLLWAGSASTCYLPTRSMLRLNVLPHFHSFVECKVHALQFMFYSVAHLRSTKYSGTLLNSYLRLIHNVERMQAKLRRNIFSGGLHTHTAPPSFTRHTQTCQLHTKQHLYITSSTHLQQFSSQYYILIPASFDYTHVIIGRDTFFLANTKRLQQQ